MLTCLIFKPGFHIVLSVVSVVRKKFIGQLQLYGNLPYKCSIQKKRQMQLFVRDRMISICPMNFFRTTDTTDTTIWKPVLNGTMTGTSFARAKVVRTKREKKAKNIVEVGEFNAFLRKHGSVEQFVSILGVPVEEEKKIFIYFTVYRKFVLLHRATGLQDL